MRWFAVFAATWCVGCSAPVAEPLPVAIAEPVPAAARPPVGPAVEPPGSPFEARLRRVRRTALDPIAHLRALAQEEASRERSVWPGRGLAPAPARVVAKLADRVAIEFDSAAEARAVVAACFHDRQQYKGEILLQERDGAIWFGRAVPHRPDLALRWGDRAVGVRIQSP